MAPADDEIELVAEIAVRPVDPEMQGEREKAERDRGAVEGMRPTRPPDVDTTPRPRPVPPKALARLVVPGVSAYPTLAC